MGLIVVIWQSDAYQATGCYNLLCSGFIQINSDIAMGATISPISYYGGSQYDISILVWKVIIKQSSHANTPFFLNVIDTISYLNCNIYILKRVLGF